LIPLLSLKLGVHVVKPSSFHDRHLQQFYYALILLWNKLVPALYDRR